MHVALGTPRSCNTFFTKQSSIVGSLNNSRPSLLVYLEQVHLLKLVLLWSAKNMYIHVAKKLLDASKKRVETSK